MDKTIDPAEQVVLERDAARNDLRKAIIELDVARDARWRAEEDLSAMKERTEQAEIDVKNKIERMRHLLTHASVLLGQLGLPDRVTSEVSLAEEIDDFLFENP